VSERDPGGAFYGQPLADVAEALAEQRRAVEERAAMLDRAVLEAFPPERGGESGEEGG
jgi:hypothetical protein